MLMDNWVEFIKNVIADSAFKDVAIAALRLLYGRPVRLSDGTGDGGVDAWMDVSPTNRVPVQFHAGRSKTWESKLNEDLAKPIVRECKSLYFVTAQTPETIEVKRKKANIKGDLGIDLEVVDARDIASFAHEPTVLEMLERVSNVHSSADKPISKHPEIDARLSFWLFHENTVHFRAEVARSVLAACLIHCDVPIPLDDLLTNALELMGGDKRHRRLLLNQIDHFVQVGGVLRDAHGIRATESLIQRTRGVLGAQELAKQKLRDDCVEALEGRVHSLERRQTSVDAIFEDLGFLLRRSIIEKLPGPVGVANATVRLNAIERRMVDVLKPSGGSADEALKSIIEVACNSVYGRNLAAAELFIQLTERDSTEVHRILTGREKLEVLLDTSVAMPMFCGLYAHVVPEWATSELAHELYEALRLRNIRIVVPHVYLEEMAAHLYAAQDYRLAIGCDPDLSRSNNFFVAHYHSVMASRKEEATLDHFDQFLRDFGLPANADTMDFNVARRKIEKMIAEQLHYFGMPSTRVSFTTALELPNEPARDKIVLEHDRCVAHWLDQRSANNYSEGFVLCTQDRWLLNAAADRDWLVMDPAALLDLIQLTRPHETPGRLACVRELASRFTDSVTERAAAVWDFLMKLDGKNFSNRELLHRARQFKEEWLQRKRDTDLLKPEDWQRFKETLKLE